MSTNNEETLTKRNEDTVGDEIRNIQCFLKKLRYTQQYEQHRIKHRPNIVCNQPTTFDETK